MKKMIANKERELVIARGQLRSRAARMQRPGLPVGFDELLDQVFDLCDSVLQELAGARLEFDARTLRLEGEASRHAKAWTHLFDRMPVACIETDPNGIILRANTLAALLLNMSVKYRDGPSCPPCRNSATPIAMFDLATISAHKSQ
jgi:PAS domain-containing protein